ncbi:hypothetical protein CsSME_00020126 [Camellia sinensis var. sinensis]
MHDPRIGHLDVVNQIPRYLKLAWEKASCSLIMVI